MNRWLPLALALLVLPATPVAAVLPPSLEVAAPGWTVEPVAFHGGSAAPPLDVDSLGRPHLMYCPPGEAWYAVRTEAGWKREFLTATPFGGVCGELALSSEDRVHVTTPVAAGIGSPLYGVRDASGWSFEPTAVGSVQAVDSLGRPHSAYLMRIDPATVALVHVWRDGSWQMETIETFASTRAIGARWVSVALDPHDALNVLYYEDTRQDVRYASRNDTGWHVEVVEHTGALNIAGREGSLALDAAGNPHAAYTVRLSSTNTEVRYAVRSAAGWAVEVASEPPPALGGRGQSPTLGISPAGPVLLYRREWWRTADGSSLDEDLLYASRTPAGWGREVAYDGEFLLNAPADPLDDVWNFAQFPAMALDRCGNPHVAMYLNHRLGTTSSSGVYYATRGTCAASRTASLRVEPRTLNLKSKGQWVTATVTVDGATAADVDLSSLELNGVPAAWARRLSDTALLAKFDRAAVAETLAPGNVTLTLAGKWTDGGTFTATDTVRVIRQGR